jgi:hypothetical protein
MGRELGEPLRALSFWAITNRARVEEARERFAEQARRQHDMAW